MKFGIILGVLIGIVILGIVVISVLMLVILPATRSTSSSGVVSSVPALNYNTITPSRPAMVTASPAFTNPNYTQPTTQSVANVSFNIQIISVSGEGLSRTVVAQLSNTGSADAHNVRARVEVFSQNSRIKINSQDYLEENFGTLKAGTTLNIQETISIGLLDSLKIARDGATFNLTIYSDERTQSSSYNYQP